MAKKVEHFDAKTAVDNIVGANAQTSNDKVGKVNDMKKEVKTLKQKSYYLTDELIRALAIKAGMANKDKSEVVREALEEHLKNEIGIVREQITLSDI